jgi:hypothetical protein
LVSSDGLTRGHQQMVAQTLKLPGANLESQKRTFALDLLQQTGLAADNEFDRDSASQLYGDNLSLILIVRNKKAS